MSLYSQITSGELGGHKFQTAVPLALRGFFSPAQVVAHYANSGIAFDAQSQADFTAIKAAYDALITDVARVLYLVDLENAIVLMQSLGSDFPEAKWNQIARLS